MKQMFVYCCKYTCLTVLWTMEWDTDNSEYTKYETVSDTCHKCKEEDKGRPKFTPIRAGTVNVTSPNDFDDLMQKRKLEARKTSGKGPNRGNR